MKIFQKNSPFLIFIIIAVLYCIGNFIWWYFNTPIFPNDDSAVHFNDIFRTGYFYYNAPLITWIMKAMFFVFGTQYFDLQIIFVNYIFFLIALYFIYKIGLELKDKETGNIAMVLFALTPAIYQLSRQYGHQEYHVMIAMIPNIYCLIKLNNFKNTKWSILYGLTVGLGLLVKDEFLPYFFTPWLYVVIRSLIEKTEKKNTINILLTILIGALISGCHYFRTEIINKVLYDSTADSVSVFSFDSLRVTTTGLSEYLLSPPIFILFIAGLIWFIYKYKNRNKWIILLWFVVPWMMITFMPHYKLPEYCLGFVPAIILISSVFITNITNIKNIKKSLVLFIIIIYSFQYIYFVYSKNDFIFKDLYYNNRILNKTYIKSKEELNFNLELFSDINKYSVKRIFLWDTTIIGYLDVCTLAVISNIYLKYNIVFSFDDFRTGFDVVITDEDGLLDKTSEEYVLKEYNIYLRNDSFQTEETKKKYIDNRVKQAEKFINYIKDNFVLVKSLLYKGHTIKIYKLNSP
ncbi:MAG: glycosyltransferase family 39 protein [Elusimicrobia bacterium]|nr:glycosyltransferase family 39 protein [Elusimicrobiota bacterium]